MFIGAPASTAILTCSLMAPMVLKAATEITPISRTGNRLKTQRHEGTKVRD
jgi:hypothetical protein